MLTCNFYEEDLLTSNCENNTILGFKVSPIQIKTLLNKSYIISQTALSYDIRIKPNESAVEEYIFDNHSTISELIKNYINDNVNNLLVMFKRPQDNNNLNIVFNALNDKIDMIFDYNEDDVDQIYNMVNQLNKNILNGSLFKNILIASGLNSINADISYDCSYYDSPYYESEDVDISKDILCYNEYGFYVLNNPINLEYNSIVDGMVSEKYYYRFINRLETSIVFDTNTTPGSNIFENIITPNLTKILYCNLSSNDKIIHQFDIENASLYSNLKEIIDEYNIPIVSTSVLKFLDEDSNPMIPNIFIYHFKSIDTFHKSFMDKSRHLMYNNDDIFNYSERRRFYIQS